MLSEELIDLLAIKHAPPVHPDYVDCDDWHEFARAIEREALKEAKVQVPTITMEQEFAWHQKNGFSKGHKQGHKQGQERMRERAAAIPGVYYPWMAEQIRNLEIEELK